MIDELLVAITRSDISCPTAEKNPGFHPSESYPEYRFSEISNVENPIYNSVRRLLFLLGLDKERYGTSDRTLRLGS